MKIHKDRLSRYMASREWKSSQEYLLGLYGAMTMEQREEIGEMLKKNKLDKR